MTRFVFAESALALAQGLLYHANMSTWHLCMMSGFEQGFLRGSLRVTNAGGFRGSNSRLHLPREMHGNTKAGS